MKRVVVVRNGWMEHYAGGDESPIGGGTYNRSSVGHERFNFKEIDGRFFGFVQTNRSDYGLNLKRIDPNTGAASSLDDVLVVFVATHPTEGGQWVVGWYQHATVFGAWQPPPPGSQREDCGYVMVCRATDGVLLPLEKRTWQVPITKGGMRQSTVRYFYTQDGHLERQDWLDAIVQRISSFAAPEEKDRRGSDGWSSQAQVVSVKPSETKLQSQHRAPILRMIRLERFKAAFKPGPIRLHNFNVLIGRNGSGKSTLIEALQWVDTTIRSGASNACRRYHGISDLVNLRSRAKIAHFKIETEWSFEELGETLLHTLKAVDEDGIPFISYEKLQTVPNSKHGQRATYIDTGAPGRRTIILSDAQQETRSIPYVDPDKLALTTAAAVTRDQEQEMLGGLLDFWARAVFLRLSPNRLADSSFARRPATEPLLDEEGQNLPALLNELSNEQRENLISGMRDMLDSFYDVKVSSTDSGRDTRVNYSLMERMPYRGRTGRREFPVPSWMLSEGTRRITAIMALLAHDPPPSLLCVEEIENGIDPWAVIALLGHLQSAADHGVQVVLTTHSPWLLDHVPLESILQVRRSEGHTVYEPFGSRAAIKAFNASIPPGTRYVREEP